MNAETKSIATRVREHLAKPGVVVEIYGTHLSPSLAGWGWSLTLGNLPTSFTRPEAEAFISVMLQEQERLRCKWEFRVIEGPPYVLPEPMNERYAPKLEEDENADG